MTHNKTIDDDADDGHQHKKRIRDSTKHLEKTRTRVKSGKELPANALEGLVISAIGPQWMVAIGEDMLICTVSGTVDCPHTSTIVTVGDHVFVLPESVESEPGLRTGTIVRVEERRTLLSRRAAGRAQKEQVLVANVDRLAIVMAAALPTYNKRLLDRYLIAADKGDLTPLIIINKIDLVPTEEREAFVEEFAAYWDDLAIDMFFVSVTSGENIDVLKGAMSGVATMFAGPSGVGKSSIINLLAGSRLRVGEISEMYLKGKHTTTGALIIPLENGGSIVDTPGIREFGIWELDKNELQYYFEEFAQFSPNCRYPSCTHTHEPDCAVKEALDEGKIDPERYLSYVILFEGIDVEDPRR